MNFFMKTKESHIFYFLIFAFFFSMGILIFQNCDTKGSGLNMSTSYNDFSFSINVTEIEEGVKSEVIIELNKAFSEPTIFMWKLSASIIGSDVDFVESQGQVEFKSKQFKTSLYLEPKFDGLIENEEVSLNIYNEDLGAIENFKIKVKDSKYSSFKMFAGGESHSCLISSEKGVGCAGSKNMLGSNATADSNQFKLISSDFFDSNKVVQIDSNGGTTCALTVNGSLYCWGLNDYGQVGIGTLTDSPIKEPQLIDSMSSGVTEISVGWRHVCAIKDQRVYCWGRNYEYAVGSPEGDVSIKNPRLVNIIDKKVKKVVTGAHSTCVIMDENSALKCWGYNQFSVLAMPTTSKSFNSPVTPSGFENDTDLVAMKSYHTCAQKNNGPLKCWGQNNHGQIGSGTVSTSQSVPTNVNGLSEGVKQVSVGEFHTCALFKDDQVHCWGRNNFGQLGDETFTTPVKTPTPVHKLFDKVILISAGLNFTCAMNSSEAFMCWGYNNAGQLGIGSTDPTINLPTEIAPY